MIFLLFMNIILKNKIIYLNDYKIKCAIGKRGIKSKKKEGDKCTPKGKLRLRYIFYRKDRVKKIKSTLKLVPIKKNYGWCDDIRSKMYNKFVKLPFKYSAEKLYLKNNTYDIIVVTDYNIRPLKKNKGSAIFIHVEKKKLLPTLGCIALSKKNLRFLISCVTRHTYIKVV